MALQEAAAPVATDAGRQGGAGSALKKVLLRPELTAIASTIIVFSIFAATGGANGFLSATGIRNTLMVSATIGIVTAPMTLLMVAGEFDLSVGSVVGAAEIMFGYPVTHGWSLWEALAFTLGGCALIGLVNGLLVIRSGIPSFLVTLATMFVVAGAAGAIANSRLGGTTIAGVTGAVHKAELRPAFTTDLTRWIPVSALWWLGLSLIAAWVLAGTRFGNWISVTGGSLESAQRAGIPVNRVKMIMFVITALGAGLSGVLSELSVNTANVFDGSNLEFEVIVAAVIGGTLLFGGLGTPVGSIFGALFFGLVYQGFYFTNIDTNWFEALLGALLMIAVTSNNATRRLATKRYRHD